MFPADFKKYKFTFFKLLILSLGFIFSYRVVADNKSEKIKIIGPTKVWLSNQIIYKIYSQPKEGEKVF